MQWQTYQAEKVAQASKDQLIFTQLEERRRLEQRIQRLKLYRLAHGHVLDDDIQQHQQIYLGELKSLKIERSPYLLSR